MLTFSSVDFWLTLKDRSDHKYSHMYASGRIVMLVGRANCRNYRIFSWRIAAWIGVWIMKLGTVWLCLLPGNAIVYSNGSKILGHKTLLTVSLYNAALHEEMNIRVMRGKVDGEMLIYSSYTSVVVSSLNVGHNVNGPEWHHSQFSFQMVIQLSQTWGIYRLIKHIECSLRKSDIQIWHGSSRSTLPFIWDWNSVI